MPFRRPLPSEFFNRNSVIVAQDLIGKYLVRKIGSKTVPLKIIEVEAYEGPRDMASHAYRGQTPRNTPMFGHPGTIYVYFTYGMHWMLNIVSGAPEHPAAVLIRGLEGISGPGRLTKRLGIDKVLNGKTLGKKTGLWIEARSQKLEAKFKIIKTPRIGIPYAGPIWSKKLYRFVLQSLKNRKGS